MTHRTAEERSLALHREVARRLPERPELLDRARSRIEAWRREGGPAAHWAARWERVLRLPPGEVATAITADDDEARDLRQASPFAGALEPRVRWEVLRRVAAGEEAR